MSANPSASGEDPHSAPAARGEAILQVRDLWLYLGGGLLGRGKQQVVLRGIDLDLVRGETLGVIGRNGCGKSTLLRVMAGILAPSRGALLASPDVTRSVLALGLGFRRDLSGRDNALLSAMLQGATHSAAMENLEAIRDFSELGDAFERKVGTYSSGMRARLGFSTGLITHVDILFIDEVLAVGDGAFREKATRALKGRIRGDQTVVLVSHNMAEIGALSDRVAWLESGGCRAVGEPAQTVRSYQASLR